MILDGGSTPSTGGGSGTGGIGNTGGTGFGGFGQGGLGAGAESGSGGFGGGCPSSCATALVNGGGPCGGETAYAALKVCAGCNDMGNCEGVCGTNLCQELAVSSDCMSCMQDACAVELHACQSD